MAARFVRVTFTCADDESFHPIRFDLVIDDSTRRTLGKWPCFGLTGSVNKRSTDFWPVVPLSNGEIDFGSDYDDSDRITKTNIHDRPIKKGEYISYHDAQGEWTYRITAVAVLGGDELGDWR